MPRIIRGKRRDIKDLGKKPVKRSFPKVVFSIIANGKSSTYTIETGYGHFISSFRKCCDLNDVSYVIEKGIPLRKLQPLLTYLSFGKLEIAKTLGVSKSTVSRWKPDSIMSSQRLIRFFEIDIFIRKGVKLFGDEQRFREWLLSPNLALGNQKPLQLVTSPFGLELLEESLEAMNYSVAM